MIRIPGTIPTPTSVDKVTPAAIRISVRDSLLSWEITPQNMEGLTVGTTAITMMRATGPLHLTTKGEGWAHQWGAIVGAQADMALSMATPRPLPHRLSMAPTQTALC